MPSKASSPGSPAGESSGGVFRSIVELQTAISRFLAETNADPRPFRWTKDPDKIIAAVKRGHQVLDSIVSAQLTAQSMLRRDGTEMVSTVRLGRDRTGVLLAAPTKVQRRTFDLLGVTLIA
jgi:hypothetical protein